MSVREWPKPVRRAVGWVLVVLSIIIAFLPAPVLLWIANTQSASGFSLPQLLGGYSLLITVPTTSIFVAFVIVQLRKKLREKRRIPFGFAIVFGTLTGLIVGLILGMITGGYSLLSAPGVGLLTGLCVWSIYRLDSPTRTPK